MAYTKLDDQFHSHPKLQLARKDANAVAGIYARALSYCGAGLTDGFVDGFWVGSIATAKLLATVTLVELWEQVARGEMRTVTGRKDSGRRKRDDVTVVMPASGFFIPDYLHYNASREEIERNRSTYESADDAHLSAQTQTRSQTQSLKETSAVRTRATDPIDRLMEVLTDADGGTRSVLLSLALERRLSEGDFEYARECAEGPGVKSPTRVAVAALKRRGKDAA